MNKNLLLVTTILLAAAFIAASVFAYYPLQLTVQPTAPPVAFAAGTNANQLDLGSGNTISVSVGQNSTSATIAIHPTYHTTYYKNVTIIKNTDNKAYNVWLVLDQVANTLPSGSKVYLVVYNKGASRDLGTGYPEPGTPQEGGNVIRVIELTAQNTNSPIQIGQLNGNGGTWEIDFLVYIPEGASIRGASATFSMHIVYTPGGEMPP
ncbi:MAG: hypothetical protein QXG81_02980 [Ignisphaera sp.]